ncbi:MAG: hypothetical protein J7L25_14920 [Deltaproteobacteria bacterium]|nr:hypothetical protein [Candidatus Tharpella aukensis]
MKTAISIPDELFLSVDQYAKSHGVSRSNLFAQAVAQFLEKHSSEQITKQLDKVYAAHLLKIDATISSLQLNSLEKEEW